MPAHRILILGATGGLGRALQSHFQPGYEVSTLGRSELDLERTDAISATLAAREFDVLLNAAGLTSPDVCEVEPECAHALNVAAPRAIAECCEAKRARMIHFSTDYVFSGEEREIWREGDETEPVNVYGRTKLAGEQAVLGASPGALVARVSWLYGHYKASHPDNVILKALQTDDLSAVADKISVPTSNADICHWVEQLIVSHPDISGPLHLCNSGTATWHSWAEVALKIAQHLGLPVKTTRVRPIALASLTQFKARRPLKTLMSNARLQGILGMEIRSWQDALEEYLVEKHQSK